MEVGSNLPPLKNDIIIEKKRELEEYREFRKLKAKVREEKRIMKIRDKLNKKRNSQMQSPHKYMNGSAMDSQMSVSPDIGQRSSAQALQHKEFVSTVGVTKFDFNDMPDDLHRKKGISFSATKMGRDPAKHAHQTDSNLFNIEDLSSKNSLRKSTSPQIGIRNISSTHYQILMAQCKL